MLRRSFTRFAAPAKNLKPPQPTHSRVNGATGGDDTNVDKMVVVGVVTAFFGWQLFGPPIIAHH